MIQETSSLDLTGNENNGASAVRVHPGCTLKLFNEYNNVGLLDTLTADVSALSSYNDQVSSLSCNCQGTTPTQLIATYFTKCNAYNSLGLAEYMGMVGICSN